MISCEQQLKHSRQAAHYSVSHPVTHSCHKKSKGQIWWWWYDINNENNDKKGPQLPQRPYKNNSFATRGFQTLFVNFLFVFYNWRFFVFKVPQAILIALCVGRAVLYCTIVMTTSPTVTVQWLYNTVQSILPGWADNNTASWTGGGAPLLTPRNSWPHSP